MKAFATIMFAYVLVVCSAVTIVNPNKAQTEQNTWIGMDQAIDVTTPTGCCGRIGDYVWLDTNRNGIQDDGDTGIDGIWVMIQKMPDGETRYTQTFTGGPLNQPGHWGFDGLCIGTYRVWASVIPPWVDPGTVPSAYTPTIVGAGNDREKDSDDHQGTMVELPLVVGGPQDVGEDLTIDFGYVTTGTICCGKIGDYVWFDENNNGLQDEVGSGIPNMTLRLKNDAGTVIQTTKTNEAGWYEFGGLCAGTYTVTVDTTTLPPGFVPSPCTVGMDRTIDNNCSPATVTLPDGNSSDLTIDFGYYMSPTEEICTEDPLNPGQMIPLGTLDVSIDGSGDVTVVFVESRNINDNSYGMNIVNWPRNHNFSDLVGSDKAQLRFTDATGKTVFDFCLDYISVKAGTPSGYDCLGVSGGEGKVLLGQASWLLDWNTSLAENLNSLCTNGNCNTGGVNLLVNSPPTSPSNTYNVAPQFAPWEFSIIYTVKVSHLAFGASGFGGVTIPLVHNSPPKSGSNAASQVPCEPSPPTTDCGECNGGVTQLTLRYLGVSNAAVVIYEGKKIEATKKLFEGQVSSGTEFTFTGVRSDLKMGADISIYVNGALNTTIHTSCSQSIGPGLVRGDFKVIDGYSKDGGRLCPMPPQPQCGQCKGGVTGLTLQYMGSTAASVVVYEGKDRKADKVLYSATVSPNEIFAFTGIRSDGTMGADISIWIGGVLHTTIHTSCSQPIGPGLVRGNFKIIDGYSKDGGKLCTLP